MKQPKITPIATSRELIDIFGGYNHNPRINDNEFYDMENLSSDEYPLLSVRKKRGESIPVVSTYAMGNRGMVYSGGLFYVYIEAQPTTGEFHYAYLLRTDTSLPLNSWLTKDTTSIRQLIPMGAKMIILPDKKVINTITQDIWDIEHIRKAGGTVTVKPCTEDGTALMPDYIGTAEPESPINGYVWLDTNQNPALLKEYYSSTSAWESLLYSYVGTTEPSNPTDGILWLDTNSSPAALKRYYSSISTWESVVYSFARITDSVNGLGTDFSEGDGVRISGFTGDLSILNTTSIIRKITTVGNKEAIVVSESNINQALTQDCSGVNPKVTVARKMPEMDFVIESQNRLWGCRYGRVNADGTGDFVNEIYCSKLGDETNWEVFDGTISTNSYRATIGSEGEWTGAVNYRGYPVFFKEHHIHSVLGVNPPYQITDTIARGVQKNSSESLATANEVLYYKSIHGVMAYSGGLPAEISAPLGDISYGYAKACAFKNKYYIHMYELPNMKPVMLVYDIARGLWHKEENLNVAQFAAGDKDIYYVYPIGNTRTGTGTLLGGDETGDIEWFAETGILGLETVDRKYVSRLNLRLWLPTGSTLTVSIEYDSFGTWETVGTVTGNSLLPFTLPIKPRRCDHFRLKLSGSGNMKLYSIAKITSQGSDV